MIIIKIIILYFIQIRHTDDFPSKGTRHVAWLNHFNFHYHHLKIVKFDHVLICQYVSIFVLVSILLDLNL